MSNYQHLHGGMAEWLTHLRHDGKLSIVEVGLYLDGGPFSLFCFIFFDFDLVILE